MLRLVSVFKYIIEIYPIFSGTTHSKDVPKTTEKLVIMNLKKFIFR